MNCYICTNTIIMATEPRCAYSAFRLRKETIKYLQDLKRAFEISYGREFSNDDFIKYMSYSIEEGDPAVWEIYCRMQMTQKELEEIAAENRRKKEDSSL